MTLAVGAASACTTSASPQPTTGPSTAAEIVPTAPTHPEHDNAYEGTGDAPTAAPPPQALLTVQAYVRAWARPDLDATNWLAGVTPYVTPAYRQLLTTVEPANIPAHTVTGPPVVVSSTTAVVVADVPTDTATVRVTCTHTGGRWLVATMQPREAAGE
ncbi:hypothetical protein [Couchioplanes azureus]|uniref:hypothetical protein n=1 Tax=Couchioplanes caeruleus TaxID=56438 RepID=UPI001670A988|nr:hypothetical protein [Couchioplanes caeruleus]